jgi:NAD+ synthase (glutamine-hydrolysing)
MKKVRVALAQINPTVGDLSGNARKVITYIKKAVKLGADIVAFPELSITGYPPEDLLLKKHFVDDNIKALHKIAGESGNIVSVVGFVYRDDGLYNAAAMISKGRVVDIYSKKHLPNYGVFDEYRYFSPGSRYPVYDFDGLLIGINVCEDIWYEDGPAKVQALSGAGLIININASPYHMGKPSFRENLVSKQASDCDAAVAYVNMVGGQDELIFDGGSFIADSRGKMIARGRQFKEDLLIADIEVKEGKKTLTRNQSKELKSLVQKDETVERVNIPSSISKRKKTNVARRKFVQMGKEEKVYAALELGTHDYVRKNGFKGVVIGMSGGVDSALVATIAVDALGAKNVQGIFMPSMYTSKESYEDATGHAKNLGIKITTIPIDSVFDSYLKTLKKHFRGMKADITEENLQARIRGNLLMAFSNKFGWLVLTTGNKSEMSVGYATLYGDMAGGFAVIKDVPKTLVYRLCEWRNARAKRELIPGRILWKEPTAELKPDQRDTDSLPPYQLLDPVLKAYVEEDHSFEEITKLGCDVDCAKKVIAMIDRSEYKRRQAPPGIKITPRAFGKDRRLPITNRYRSY